MTTPEKQSKPSDHFDSQKEILAYLKGCGYELSKQGLSKHHTLGKFTRDKKTGKFLRKKIDKYAKDNWPLASTGKKHNAEIESLQQRKLQAEIRRQEASAANEENKLKITQGEYVPRKDMELELIQRALVLDATLRHTLKVSAAERIKLCNGDHSKHSHILEREMQIIDEAMNTFASTDDFVVEVNIEKPEKALD